MNSHTEGRDGDAPDEPNESDGRYRRATVLFADLSGYKAMLASVASLPSNFDATQRVVRALENIAYNVVSRRHGILNEVRGDGIVALFGLREPGRAEFDVCDAVGPIPVGVEPVLRIAQSLKISTFCSYELRRTFRWDCRH